jgi:hypothetical protein
VQTFPANPLIGNGCGTEKPANPRRRVNGYTDTSGTPKYNQGLSVRRATKAGDNQGARPAGQGIRHPEKQPTELDGSGELAALVERGTDGGGICLGDGDEHARSMGRRTTGGKLRPGSRPSACVCACFGLVAGTDQSDTYSDSGAGLASQRYGHWARRLCPSVGWCRLCIASALKQAPG